MTTADGTTRATLRYNASLDGLRALAVTAVLIYHGYVGWLRGGFLGVDLFFVISGYLITTLLILEYESTGRIGLGGFWLRRSKRLLPPVLLVVAAVAVGAVIFGEVNSDLWGEAFATLAYVANWRFAVDDVSYFESFGDPSPLRHMWSLAVEEQWYLVWPMVLRFGFVRFKPNHRAH